MNKDDTLYLRHILECVRRVTDDIADGRERFMRSSSYMKGETYHASWKTIKRQMRLLRTRSGQKWSFETSDGLRAVEGSSCKG